MNRLADGWSQQNTDQALACFTDHAIYMEPPKRSRFNLAERRRGPQVGPDV